MASSTIWARIEVTTNKESCWIFTFDIQGKVILYNHFLQVEQQPVTLRELLVVEFRVPEQVSADR